MFPACQDLARHLDLRDIALPFRRAVDLFFTVVLAGRRARCLGHGFFLFDIEVLHSTKGSEGEKKIMG